MPAALMLRHVAAGKLDCNTVHDHASAQKWHLLHNIVRLRKGTMVPESPQQKLSDTLFTVQRSWTQFYHMRTKVMFVY